MRWNLLIQFFCITCLLNCLPVNISVPLSAADAVIERYIELLQKDPKHGAVFDRVYHYFADTGEADIFLNQCRSRTEKEPDNTAAQMLYGLAAQRQSDWKTAAAAFRKAAQLDSGNYLPAYYLGEVLVSDKQFQDGIALLEEAVNRLKKTSATGKQLRDVLQMLAKTLLRIGEQKRAEAVWQQLEALFPDDNEVVLQIAETFEAGGQFGE
ncbi:MAG: tetratricopeptide repeat protein, partial [Planctomycetaceae bacterium]|nr:tetratricopeptide repeat protein [Planctomycetaceae bacterium]